MAGAGYKLYATGDILTAAQVNTYLQEQTVMVFASAAARTSALASVLSEGMISYLKDTNSTEYYSGSAWVAIGGAGGTPAFVGASAYNSATQSLANDTFTARNYNTENFDTDTFHDNATNNTRFTIPTGKGGKYLITAATRFATNSSGRRIVAPRKNGTTFMANTQEMGATSIAAAEPTIVMTSIVELVAGDYIELMAYQNSGGALNIAGTSDQSTLVIQFLGA